MEDKDEIKIGKLKAEMRRRIRPIIYEYMTHGLKINHIRHVFRQLVIDLEE